MSEHVGNHSNQIVGHIAHNCSIKTHNEVYILQMFFANEIEFMTFITHT